MKSITSLFAEDITLKYFSHCRVNNKGEFFCIANNAEYPNYHFVDRMNPPSAVNNFESYQSCVRFLTTNDDLEVGWPKGTIADVKDRFDYENLISISYRFPTFIEFYMFSLDMENAIPYFCNHQDYFQQIIFLYKDKAKKIIDHCSRTLNQIFSNQNTGTIL